MVKKAKATATVSVNFRITLDVGMNLGAMSLEDALARARKLTVTDVVDLSGLDHNDSDIKVSWLSENVGE